MLPTPALLSPVVADAAGLSHALRYRKGPQPAELGGQRALDFVLDNSTLRDFNRDLLYDIKLLAVYKRTGKR